MADLETCKKSILALDPTSLITFFLELRRSRRCNIVTAATRRASVIKKPRIAGTLKKVTDLVSSLSLEEAQDLLTQLRQDKAS